MTEEMEDICHNTPDDILYHALDRHRSSGESATHIERRMQMSGPSMRKVIRTLGLLGAVAVAIRQLSRFTGDPPRTTPFSWLFTQTIKKLDWAVGWHKLPLPL